MLYISIMKKMKETKQPSFKDLQTVNNYAVERGITPQYIHKLVKDGKMDFFLVDGVKFVDTVRFASIPVINRRK